MKEIIILTTILASALLFAFCKSQKAPIDPNMLKRITWGSGGGITGKEASFSMTEEGLISRFSGLDNATTDLKTIKKKVAKGLFATYETLELGKIDFNHPGNMYYFVELKDSGVAKRITWGDEGNPVDSKIKDFYKLLNQLTKKENDSSVTE